MSSMESSIAAAEDSTLQIPEKKGLQKRVSH